MEHPGAAAGLQLTLRRPHAARWEVRQGVLGGPLLAHARQHRRDFGRSTTVFYADADSAEVSFAISLRPGRSVAHTWDVADAHGASIGWFALVVGNTVWLNTTFRVGSTVHGLQGTGTERSTLLALARRSTLLPGVPVHFDVVDAQGATMLSIQRSWGARSDRVITAHPTSDGTVIDWRLAAAVAVLTEINERP